MKFIVEHEKINQLACDCLVIGVFSQSKLTGSAQIMDRVSGGYLSNLLRQGDISNEFERNTLLPLQHLPKLAAKRLLVVGLGDPEQFDARRYKKTLCNIWSFLKNTPATSILLALTEVPVAKKTIDWKIQQIVLSAKYAQYVYKQAKTSDKEPTKLSQITLAVDKNQHKAYHAILTQSIAISEGMETARRLGDSPANICTPTYLATQAQALGKQYNSIKTQVLNEAAMQKLGMGSLLSVSQGSDQPAKLIIMQYHGTHPKEKPVVLVGKGVTFDSGGISLKPGPNMDEMKYDMMGAATVFGCLKACAEAKLPINVVGVIPTTENLPNGSATKPGDVFTSMSGQTIEVLNTDAEGRLILCDALTYCERFKPDVVIDIATLTGAILVALGKHKTGLFSNSEALSNALLQAGKKIDDECWLMPMGEEYTEELKSNFADLANIGSRHGGSITAACFLSKFTEKYTWAHLDIAGTAWLSGDNKGATGRPIPLLMQYLLDRCA
jgi:leucyl aminopeptidase